MEARSLLDQLVEFYYTHDAYQEPRLPKHEVTKTIQVLLQKDRIIAYAELGEVLGYCEYWRVTFEQLGRMVCHERFDVSQEDIETGPIAVVNNVTIKPCARRSTAIRYLRDQFWNRNADATYYTGEAARKKENLWKVFKVSSLKTLQGAV